MLHLLKSRSLNNLDASPPAPEYWRPNELRYAKDQFWQATVLARFDHGQRAGMDADDVGGG